MSFYENKYNSYDKQEKILYLFINYDCTNKR